jgi:hypothetical protein
MDVFNRAYIIAQALLEGHSREEINQEDIRQAIANIRLMLGFHELDEEELQVKLEADFGVNDFAATQLVNEDIMPWLYKTDIEFNYGIAIPSF